MTNKVKLIKLFFPILKLLGFKSEGRHNPEKMAMEYRIYWEWHWQYVFQVENSELI